MANIKEPVFFVQEKRDAPSGIHLHHSRNKEIDYSKQDFTQNGETYDLIFDILGRVSFACVKNFLNPQGILLYASFKGWALLDMLWTALFNSKKVICALADEKVKSLKSAPKVTFFAGKVIANLPACGYYQAGEVTQPNKPPGSFVY